MKKILMLLALAGLAMSVAAVPARRGTHVVRNSDGTELTVELRGDETFHYYVTTDGTPVRRNEAGDWVPDRRDVAAMHRKALVRRNDGRQRLAQRVRRAMKAVRAPYRADQPTPKRGLLILVNFKDKAMRNGARSQTIYNQMMNAIGNPYGKNYGSVREYFRAQSYGLFDIEFDVVGPVTVSQNMEYYGANDPDGYDLRPGEMVAEACRLVNDQVNFADYDWDGDGEVENIYVTYAGYGESSDLDSRLADTIWPHQWALSDPDNCGTALSLDGVTVDTYACGSELAGYQGSTLDGIGTMCHEYSHCLGLPDFYDTDQEDGNNFGMDEWSLMDYGCYNGDGYCPAGYTAYERMFCGWLQPTELKEPAAIRKMKNIEQNPEAYIIYNDKNRNEYYLLANHQQLEWDKSAPGHGMMVLHVDYSQSAWYNNTVNTIASHQRMTLIPADNILSSQTLKADLYPGSGKNTELTDESTPAATVFNANTDGQKLMHKPITGITEVNQLVSFDFMGGASALPAPELADPTDVTSTSFKAHWAAGEGAVSYNLRYTVQESGGKSLLDILKNFSLFENFEAFFIEDETATADATKDIGDELDSYMVYPGWSGYKVYEGLFGCKMGTASVKGMLTSPLVKGNTSGRITVYLELSDWFNYATLTGTGVYKYDGSKATVSVLDASGEVVKSQTVEPGKITDDGISFLQPEPTLLTFDEVPSSYRIRVEGSKRLYVMYFLCFNEAYTLEDVNLMIEHIYGEEEQAPARLRSLRSTARAPRRSIRRATSEPTVIRDIRATEYEITGLPEGATVDVAVQAVDADGRTSAWSPMQQVVLTKPDAVLTPAAAASESAAYDLAGRRLSASSARGIVIVGGRKVFIK